MARVVTALSVEFRPAFHALYAVAEEIACTHGEDAAMEWVRGVLDRDFDLFCRLTTDARPSLRLIKGGRDAL